MSGEKVRVCLPIELTGMNAHIAQNCKDIRKIRIVKENSGDDELSFLVENCKNIQIADDIYLTTSQYAKSSNDSKIIFNYYYAELTTRNHDMDYILKTVEKWKSQVEDYFRERYIKDDRCFVYWFNDAQFPMCKMKYEQYSIDENRKFNNLFFEGNRSS